MPVITATQVTIYSNISTGATTITTLGLIPLVQDRIASITNNQFLTDLYLQDSYTFNATDRTIISKGGNSFAADGFAAGDEVYVYYSYKNDGYYVTSAVAGSTLTLITGSSVVDELSGRSILISVVKWPTEIMYAAAQMIKWDYDDRHNVSQNVKSKSLGPWSESYGVQSYGYPDDLLAPLMDFRVARIV